MKFLHDITHRNGQGSSKKFWYSIACLTATGTLCWITYANTMEDWAYITLFLTYLLTVGGFEVILKMTQMIVDIKTGHTSSTTTTTTKDVNNVPVDVVP